MNGDSAFTVHLQCIIVNSPLYYSKFTVHYSKFKVHSTKLTVHSEFQIRGTTELGIKRKSSYTDDNYFRSQFEMGLLRFSFKNLSSLKSQLTILKCILISDEGIRELSLSKVYHLLQISK